MLVFHHDETVRSELPVLRVSVISVTVFILRYYCAIFSANQWVFRGNVAVYMNQLMFDHRRYRRRSRPERKLRPFAEITLRQRHLSVGMTT